MNGPRQWSHLEHLCSLARLNGRLALWLFGSALSSETPQDLDILLIYTDRNDVVRLRNQIQSQDLEPPFHIIAMTHEEERFYRFIADVGAIRLVEPSPASNKL
ncbi:hypothetical protein GCM10023081_43020 [Arthrobacter ginkgonis]|uniref:Polymerase beta nucleotidyltransferase domain-containing protein n=1 Tax=Arthrobacter ginkgonis TaxID=1630594 RepID=A0ABP7DE96_9MICC